MMKNTLFYPVAFCSAILVISLLSLPALAVQDIQQHNHDTDHQQHHTDDGHQHEHHEHDDFTQLGSHVHGVATLTFVLEGNEALLALQVASINVVGFEHQATTPEQQQEVAAAIAVFNKGDWFRLNDDANCEISNAEASSDVTAGGASGQHADFYANYQLLCQRPGRLREMQLSLFNLLPALENVQIQWVINEQQGAATATLEQAVIRF